MPKLRMGGCGFLKKPVGRSTNFPHSIPTSQLPKVSSGSRRVAVSRSVAVISYVFPPSLNGSNKCYVGSGTAPQEQHGSECAAVSILFLNRLTSCSLHPFQRSCCSSDSVREGLFFLFVPSRSSLPIVCLFFSVCSSPSSSVSDACTSMPLFCSLFSMSPLLTAPWFLSSVPLPSSFKPKERVVEESVKEAAARACRRARRRWRKASCSLTPRLLCRNL